MSNTLYDRVVRQGTVAEPQGVPDPQFALPSTVNWMRGLAILTPKQKFNFQAMSGQFNGVSRHAGNIQQENSALEQIFLALHQLSALTALKNVACKSDVARLAIVCWYYGIYYAASSMIVAQDGSFQDDHTGTANSWDRQFASRILVPSPFDFRVSSLVEATSKSEVASIRGNNRSDLLTKPTNAGEALGATSAYLSGTANWYRWRIMEDLKGTKEFKDLGVSDFRTKAARQLRDSRYQRKSVGFLHQAGRYRGKANYREALFLAYGANTETFLSGFIDDLDNVLSSFLSMSSAFVAARVGRATWLEFVTDVENRKSFTLSSAGVWS